MAKRINYVISATILVIFFSMSSLINASENVLVTTSCDSDIISLPDDVKSALMTTNMTQCAMPFGILIAADEQMPKKYVNLLASIIAELLDQDRDGLPDDPKLHKSLKRWETVWLAMPTDPNRWEKKQIPELNRYLGYDMIAPKWWMNTEDEEQTKMMLVEEAFHFISQFGLSEVYPTKFSVDSWGSTIAKETKLAACEWWQHPENPCPNNPQIIQGDCTGPSCDVTEFFQQVVILRAGMEPGWSGIGFPDSKENLNELLSNEMKDVLDDGQYHIINKPLQFDYVSPVIAAPAPAPAPAPAVAAAPTAAQPTGMNKVLVEKYGYTFVGGKVYAPGKVPAAATSVVAAPAAAVAALPAAAAVAALPAAAAVAALPAAAPVAALPAAAPAVAAVPAAEAAVAAVPAAAVAAVPAAVAQPTGINKVLVEKYGYTFVGGKVYAPGKVPAAAALVLAAPAAAPVVAAPAVALVLAAPAAAPVVAAPAAALVLAAPAAAPVVAAPAVAAAPTAAQPTGINKVLVEKYGYTFVGGKVYAPGKVPAAATSVVAAPAAPVAALPAAAAVAALPAAPVAALPAAAAVAALPAPAVAAVPAPAVAAVPAAAAQPTGINKVLVEKYGYTFVGGKVYAPGRAPKP